MSTSVSLSHTGCDGPISEGKPESGEQGRSLVSRVARSDETSYTKTSAPGVAVVSPVYRMRRPSGDQDHTPTLPPSGPTRFTEPVATSMSASCEKIPLLFVIRAASVRPSGDHCGYHRSSASEVNRRRSPVERSTTYTC